MEDDKALAKLVDDAVAKEKELQEKEQALATQNKEFAEMMVARRRQDDELKVLWQMVKDYMEENDITEHSNDFIELKLAPSGKYRLVEGADIEDVPDEVCVIKKSIDNKKVTAYAAIKGELPEGVESTGNILRKKFLVE